MNEAWQHLYVIGRVVDRLPTAPVKIGISGNPDARLKALQTASPYELVLFTTFLIPNRKFARVIEAAMHDFMSGDGMRGEWFDIDPITATIKACQMFEVVAEELNPDNPSDVLDACGAAENARQLMKYMSARKGGD